MKLKFTRETDTIVTQMEADGDVNDFDYLTFIKRLVEGETLDAPEYPEDITELEREEIERMIEKINESLVIQDDNDEAELT